MLVKPGKVAFASAVGHTIELYDLLICGTASAIVFGKIFFPTGNAVAGVLLAFATFGVGFLARPVGAVVIGHFGDRVGRKPMLVLTLTVTGVCTALIGLLPTYSQLGLAAPILLVLLRIVQGFFFGGEENGAALMAVEHAPDGHRGWYGSWTFVGAPAGMILASAAFAVSAAVSGPAFLDWGWRLPFLLSLLLVAVGLYVRLRIEESPEFRRDDISSVPLAEVPRRTAVLAAGLNAGVSTFIVTLVTLPLGMIAQDVAMTANLLGAAVQVPLILLFARLSDRVGRFPVMCGGMVFLAAYAFPWFWMLEHGMATLGIVIGYAGAAIVFGPLAVYFAELFEPRVRYSGAAVSFQIGSGVGGGMAPLVATALLSGGQSWPVALYLVIGALISLACLTALRAPARPRALV